MSLFTVTTRYRGVVRTLPIVAPDALGACVAARTATYRQAGVIGSVSVVEVLALAKV